RAGSKGFRVAVYRDPAAKLRAGPQSRHARGRAGGRPGRRAAGTGALQGAGRATAARLRPQSGHRQQYQQQRGRTVSQIDPVLGGATSQLVSVALDAALARHAAIAANIANADTPNYRPLMARFDQLVTELQGRVTDRTQDEAILRDAGRMQESLQSSPLVADPSAPQVELDMQMADLA